MSEQNNKIKVLLVSLNYNDSYTPLGIANLKSFAFKDEKVRRNFDISLETFSVHSFKEEVFLSLLKKESPDILGFTSWCWNKNRISILSSKAKEEINDLTVLIGGPQAEDSYLENKDIDFLVHGRGELAFRRLLKKRLKNVNINKKDIPGISFRESREVFSTKYKPLDDLNKIPSPYLNDYIDLNRYERAVMQVEYGCNVSSCYFCDIPPKDKQKRFFSLKRIEEEISYITKRSNFLEIINCNLNSNRRRFIGILNSLRKNSHTDLETIIWLDHKFFKPGDEKLIKSISGKKVLEFELRVSKEEGLSGIKKEEIKNLANVLSYLRGDDIVNCLSVMLDNFPEDDQKINDLEEKINNIVSQDNFNLFLYPRMTGKNYYDDDLLKDGDDAL